METPVAGTGVSGLARRPRSVGRVDLGLALDCGLADKDSLALEPVERLGELEVFSAAEFRRRLRGLRFRLLGFELLAGFLARLLADVVLHFGALAALQVLLEIGFAGSESGEQVALR